MNRKLYDAQKKYMAKNPIKVWAMQTIARHRKEYEIKIRPEELVELASKTKYCIYCGTQLIWQRGNGRRASDPSLDRKDNGKIISINEVQIICCRCNAKKSKTTHGKYSRHEDSRLFARK